MIESLAEFSPISLLGLDRSEIDSVVDLFGEPPYRAKQIMEAVYRQRVESVEQISTLSQQLRGKLTENGVSVGLPRIEKRFISRDGTVRYLIGFADGQSVETVWMPEGDGGEAGDGSEAGELAERFVQSGSLNDSTGTFESNDPSAGLKARPTATQRPKQGQNQGRSTICISSQVGCAVDCQFCLTALLGVKRNLTAGEIVGQVCVVLNDQKVSPPQDRVNLVFMGMGEPFLNYDNFMKAVRLLVEEVGIAESRMTVSTAGIVPGIVRFAQEKVRPKLAISLNASNDEVREEIMPITRKWDIADLLDAIRQVPLRPRERVTFEYV